MAAIKKIEVKTITLLITAFLVVATIGAIIGTGLYIAGVIERVSSPNKQAATTKGGTPTVTVLDKSLLEKIVTGLNARIDQPLPDDSNLSNPFLRLPPAPAPAPPPPPPPPPASPEATE